MSSIAILLLLVMLARSRGGEGFLPNMPNPLAVDRARKKRGEAPGPAVPLPPVAQAAKTTPAPWPQVMPAGLPAFGPAGWVPDEPPPAQVQARAWQLLAPLWKSGAGTRKTEQTAGRWITYVASPMGKKKGVVAYRLRADAPPAPPEAPPAPAPMLTS